MFHKFTVLIKMISSRILSLSSPARLSAANSIGLFLGMLPLIGVRLPFLLVVSLLFRLNFFALLIGMFITIIFPFLHLTTFWVGEKLAGYDIPFFTLRYLSFSHLEEWTESGQYHLAGSIIVGLILAGLFYPLFLFLNKRFITRIGHKGKTKGFVFMDDSGNRWSLFKKSAVLFLVTAIFVVSLFGISISINPFLPSLGLPTIHRLSVMSPIADKMSQKTESALLKLSEKKHPTVQVGYWKHHFTKHQVSGAANQHEVYAFYVNWDENSKSSLEHNLRSINVLVPEWYRLQPDLTLSNETDDDVKQLALSHQIKIEPLVSNFVNGKWNSDTVHQLLQPNQAQKQWISQLGAELKRNGMSGVNIDFEQVHDQDRDKLTAFMTKLAASLHRQGLSVTMDVPANDEHYDYYALSKVVDKMIVMLYDEHYANGEPGPISSQDWFTHDLNALDIPPEKMIVSLGNYGYDWVEGSHEPADVLTFGSLMEMASESKLQVRWDDKSRNPYVTYKVGEDSHVVWFLDGVTFYNQWKMALNNGVKDVAIWRLGSEDPTIWKFLHHPNNSDLTQLENPDPVNYLGQGEVLRILSDAQSGNRNIVWDGDFIKSESYEKLPQQFEMMRYGKPKDKELVLSFDDGPDPEYTPQILDILKHYGIKGAFFIVGENGEANPDLVERIYREGHEVGNHSFTHPNISEVTPWRTKMELNATQRLFQELTGHSMTLFRPPYVADAEPSTPAELIPILRAQEMGYTMVGELIDPNDWMKPGTQEIIKRVLNDVHKGNVILLHDAGGDRSQTVKALPVIIETLQKQGYKFVTISQLLGKTENQIMPAVQSQENPFMTYDRVVFDGMMGSQMFVSIVFLSAIGLGILRMLFLVYYSYRQKRRSLAFQPTDETYQPFVSVVIAAYNEESVINKTIQSILKSKYPDFEVIVVDDGSKDSTAEVVREMWGNHPQVRLIQKENGGKSSAVNQGFMEAKGEIVVALDADTLISPDAIRLLARHFSNPRVAAVSGNVRVGNIRNLLTQWQHIEYVTGFNLERRAFSQLNCITVVPGAIGAWRKDVVASVGYFQEDTLAEDTDITLTLLRKGYQIEFEEKAYAYTESPEDVKSLLKQRYRWSYGTLQCLWKHRPAFVERSHKPLAYIAMPNMWLFQYIFQALSPLADIFFFLGLFQGNTKKVMIFYGIFLAMDLLSSLYAFSLEKVNPKPLLWLFIQRFVYRQLMTYVIIKSIISAIRGGQVGWGKLKRLGNVEQKTGETLHTSP
ncbi:DUF2062 domain-containing protein [Brevibacillus ginsengisoli]|uniref:DUF2062 domain-containing protein n=1 Tax=Brevibacillus ginsengisoli TaxID=363854 RepID=UPI003CE749CD